MNCRRTTSEMKEFSPPVTFLIIYFEGWMFFFFVKCILKRTVVLINCCSKPLRKKGWFIDAVLPIYEICFSGKMQWIFRYFLVCVLFTNLVPAEDQCRIEINIRGMILKGFVFKRMTVAAPHFCDFLCEREIICQSYNFNRKEQICELNNRTKDARPENFLSDPEWFYIRRFNGRGNYSANNVG